MNEKNAKRLEELSAIARDPAKLSKLLLEGFEVCRGLGDHFETMNGSPQLKRLSNLAADMFGIMHTQLSNQPPIVPATAAPAVSASPSRFFDAVEKALENPELRADIILQPGAIAEAIVAMPARAARPCETATLATEPEPFEERRAEDRTEGRLGDIAYQTPDEETKFPEGQTIPMGEPIPPPPDDWVPPPTKAPAAKKPKPAPTSGPPMF